ncbi:MAG TPA: alpha amylase C-terminal domain-containing protein, partial [Gammaproteobacteria bacterium]|nr:alpha amylase C-terminal domain-containing protein [Gammaproteobacteria bacterium]
GKASMLHKMPGDDWLRFANLRLLYTYMYTYPGRKLLFMGSEFGQRSEWNFDAALEWQSLEHASHQGVLSLVRDLNHLYVDATALHRHDFEPDGFEWIDCHDAAQSVISYLRRDEEGVLVVVLNFTPVPRTNYRLGVPEAGRYREALNSDSQYYGGGNMGNGGTLHTQPTPWMGREQSLVVTLPPLAGIVLRLETP